MTGAWSEQELLMAMNLYCRLPFGKLHQHNPEIKALAVAIGRTPSAVAMKLCNFASLDPMLAQKGLEGASKADRAMWAAFHDDWTGMAAKSEAAFELLMGTSANEPDVTAALPTGPSEKVTTVNARRHQQFFRRAVLSSYDSRCALTGLATPALLVASHIIPWSEAEQRRADPTNGICLNVLHDRAFDRNLITFDEDYRLVLSPQLKDATTSPLHQQAFLALEGVRLRLPERFCPDLGALAIHRKRLAL